MIALADIKIALGIDGANTDDDAYLEAQLAAVTGAIEAITLRQWVQDTYIEHWRGPGNHRLFVVESPIVSVTRVTVNGVDTSSADYEIDAKAGRIVRRWGSFGQARTVEVEYLGGHDPIPAWLSLLINAVMAERYALRGTVGTVADTSATGRDARISIQDVGTVAYEKTGYGASSAGAEAAGGAAATILGAHVATLLMYRDRAQHFGAGGG